MAPREPSRVAPPISDRPYVGPTQFDAKHPDVPFEDISAQDRMRVSMVRRYRA
jgi:hypothetical protein